MKVALVGVEQYSTSCRHMQATGGVIVCKALDLRLSYRLPSLQAYLQHNNNVKWIHTCFGVGGIQVRQAVEELEDLIASRTAAWPQESNPNAENQQEWSGTETAYVWHQLGLDRAGDSEGLSLLQLLAADLCCETQPAC